MAAGALAAACQTQFERAAPAPPPIEPLDAASRLSSEIRPSQPADELPPQRMARGECGLFLWSRDDSPRFIFFSGFSGSGARMILDGRIVELERRDAFASAARMPLEQSYATATGRLIEVKLTPGESLDGGVRIPAASISAEQEDGWSRVTPAVGMTACQLQ